MKNTKVTWIVIAVIVVLIIIVAAVWLNAKTVKAPEVSSSSSTPAASSDSSSTASNGTGTYANSDYSFTYRSGWSISSYKPFTLTTFGGKYETGGSVPAGGAEIDVATTTVYGNLQNIMQAELRAAEGLVTSAITVDGTPCAKAAYHVSVGGTVLNDAAVYCVRGNELWKFYLSYRADDAAAGTHTADFASVLGSMKLL